MGPAATACGTSNAADAIVNTPAAHLGRHRKSKREPGWGAAQSERGLPGGDPQPHSVSLQWPAAGQRATKLMQGASGSRPRRRHIQHFRSCSARLFSIVQCLYLILICVWLQMQPAMPAMQCVVSPPPDNAPTMYRRLFDLQAPQRAGNGQSHIENCPERQQLPSQHAHQCTQCPARMRRAHRGRSF